MTANSRPHIVVTRGELRHRAVVSLEPTLVLTYTLNLVGETGFLDLDILTDLQQFGDLSLRFKTDINSRDSLFTDLNGHTIQQHKYKEKLHIQVCEFLLRSTLTICMIFSQT